MGCSVFILTLGSVIYFHYCNKILVIIGFISVSLCLYLWLKDVVREATYQGLHSRPTLRGLKMGFILFIVSEILLFFSFF
jgi:cytochrome c oxidase subunit 3